jgi:UDP-N-acetylmuramate dehydrogenase
MVPIGPHTTFGLGGTVHEIIHCHSNDELLIELKKQKESNSEIIIIAGGSNVIFPDGHLDKTIIRLSGGDMRFDKNLLVVEAGAILDETVLFAIRAGRGGLEALSLIPGSVGGAIVGNAGAYGQSISDHIVSVSFFDGQSVQTFKKEECDFSYRSSIFKKNRDWIVLRAKFSLPKKRSEALFKKREEISSMRLSKYPPGLRCPGSYFKNIIVENLSADSLKLIPQEKIIGGKVPTGFLLEKVGACGEREGGIYVSSYHGNLFINDGTGTTLELITLTDRLSKKVFDYFGIKLEPEVVYIL